MTDHSALIERLEAAAESASKTIMGRRGQSILHPLLAEAAAALRDLTEWRDRMKVAASKSNDEVCQSLGKALGYPWFKDDQVNFPGSTEANGVCVGEHVAESIADEAARKITETTQWRDIATFTGSGQAHPAIIAVPTAEGEWIIGEGWLRAEEDDGLWENGWWWAGTSPGEYHDSPIVEMNHGPPKYWLPLPSAPNQAKEAGE